MQFTITFAKDWRYRDRKRGQQVVPAGSYRVPDEMKAAVAQMAIDAGAAVRSPEAPRRNRRKGPAPENKLAVPAENKSTLV